MEKLLTILTPTYNRGKYLEDIFKVLQQQTNQNFEWLIVDDGSTDNTKEIVESFIESNKLRIRYFCKENGGKHTAVNYGLKYISTKLTVILDSDDTFTNDAVEVIEKTYNENKNEENICGFTFLRQRKNGDLFGKAFPREGRYNFSEWRLSKISTGEPEARRRRGGIPPGRRNPRTRRRIPRAPGRGVSRAGTPRSPWCSSCR